MNSPGKASSGAFQPKGPGAALPQEVEPINENDMENLSENQEDLDVLGS